MIHILYRPTQSKPGYVNQIGYYMNYAIGRIPDEYIDSRIELHKFDATVIPENIAPGFKFADIYKDSMSIRINSHIMDEFPMLQSSEAENEKVKYFLTDEDKALAVRFNKVVMIKVISDRFTEKLKELMLDASLLEKATWEEQKREALLYQQDNTTSTPLIDILAEGREITKSELVDKILLNVNSYNIKLANLLVEQQKLEKKVKDCQTIADCHRLRHEKFGMSMSYQQQMDEQVERSPLTLKIDF
jgi:hypothetical protein